MDLIQIVSKMYVSTSGRFTRTALYNLLKHMTAAKIDECVEYFTEMDLQRHGHVTLGKQAWMCANKIYIRYDKIRAKNQTININN